MLCYVVAYLDRVNIGFAKLQMLTDLRFSETVYGLGAGMFFIGYFFFEVPSNIILHRVGARIWIGRIMITWGLVSAAFMFVTSAGDVLRPALLLGIAEAGFFPGIILYLTYWYPSDRRAHMIALFMAAIPLSGICRRAALGLDHAGVRRRERLARLAVAVPARGGSRDRRSASRCCSISTTAFARRGG